MGGELDGVLKGERWIKYVEGCEKGWNLMKHSGEGACWEEGSFWFGWKREYTALGSELQSTHWGILQGW